MSGRVSARAVPSRAGSGHVRQLKLAVRRRLCAEGGGRVDTSTATWTVREAAAGRAWEEQGEPPVAAAAAINRCPNGPATGGPARQRPAAWRRQYNYQRRAADRPTKNRHLPAGAIVITALQISCRCHSAADEIFGDAGK